MVVNGVTCRISLKSHAASFFMSETLSAKHLIVPLPNVGTSRNLRYAFKWSPCVRLMQNGIPFVKGLNTTFFFASGV